MMALTNTDSIKEWTITGAPSTGPFTVGFPVYAASDLIVSVQTGGSGTFAVKTVAADYTVSAPTAPNEQMQYPSGATITLNVAAAVGDVVRIERTMLFTQPKDYETSGGVRGKDVEASLNRTVMLIQQVQRALVQAQFAGSGLTFSTPVNTFLAAATQADMRAAIAPFAEAITTRGDVIRGSSSGAAERLALGALGYVLGSDGTDAVWVPQTYRRISSGSVTNVAVVDIANLPAGYDTFMLKFRHAQPASAGVTLAFYTSPDNGSSYTSASGAYAWAWNAFEVGAGANGGGSNGDTHIPLTRTLDNGAYVSGRVMISGAVSASRQTALLVDSFAKRNGGGYISISGGGERLFAEANTAIRLGMSSGNIASMDWVLYGLRDAA